MENLKFFFAQQQEIEEAPGSQLASPSDQPAERLLPPYWIAIAYLYLGALRQNDPMLGDPIGGTDARSHPL